MDHFCPGCGKLIEHAGRNSWLFCHECATHTTDGTGRRITFSNTSLSGGLAWRYGDAGEWTDCISVRCLVRGQPVMVSAARFGGIVVQPVPHEPQHNEAYDCWDLTEAEPLPSRPRR